MKKLPTRRLWHLYHLPYFNDTSFIAGAKGLPD